MNTVRAVAPSRLLLLWLLLSIAACRASSDATGQAEAHTEAKAERPRPSGPSEGGSSGRHVSIVLSSNNRGEIDVCGCVNRPMGGLARRAGALGTLKDTPRLVLDAGEALFPSPEPPTDDDRTRAQAIVEAMATMDYAAMGVGPRDLADGGALLRKAPFPVLSANLLDPQGHPAFAATQVVEVGGLRFGLLGLSTADPTEAEARAYLRAKLTADDPVRAAARWVPKLAPKVDRVVVLGTLSPPEARRVASAVPGIDLMLVARSGRFTTAGERVGSTLIYEAGSKGQILLRLDLLYRGEGPLGDAVLQKQAEEALQAFDQRAQHLEARSGTEPGVERAIEENRRQREEMAEKTRFDREAPGGLLTPIAIPLDELVPADEALAQRVAALPPVPKKR
ncbi:MAG: hypothetical protein D6729_05170 [Deltaproteobacteria bacterium]|nr:MAG: hypothetical protein D6729_05170 [Deltaproteobacteria bacterium]